MNHVFISYNREDCDFAEALMGKIQAAGFTVWMDTDTLRAGENWRAEIDQGIKEAIALVLIISPEAKASEYVTFEWAYALGAGIKVIPVLLKPTELHPRLDELHHLNFTNRQRPWHDVIQELQTTVAAHAPHTVRVSPDAPPVIQQAARALDSMDEKERTAALDSLGQMNHPSAIEVLADAVGHPVRDVRILASYALSDFKDPRALPGLIEAIRCDYKEMGFWRLTNCGSAALPGLLESLRDEEANVRAAAARALGRIRDNLALPALTEALHDKDEWVRAAVAEALGDFPEGAGLAGVKTALVDPASRVRKGTAVALGTIGSVEAVHCLSDLLQDEDWDVRNTAVCSLGLIGNSGAVPGLIAALRDADGQVRQNAASMLGQIGDVSAVPALLATVHDDDEESMVRSRAFEALEKIGNDAAVAGLIKALEDDFANVRYGAVEALGKIGNATAVPALLAALHDRSDHVRESAVRALRCIHHPSAAAALIDLLSDKANSSLHRDAAEALKDIGTPEALVAFRKWRLTPKPD